MAKELFISDEAIEKMIAEIRASLKKSKGKIEIKQDLPTSDKRATIYFTSEAWTKMQSLVTIYTTEVQWHGLVRRISENEFEIYDILVFPHSVSASTVVSDQEKYSEWLNNLSDDEFNAMHLHGHSHVNMAVSPSGVDMQYRENVIATMPLPQEEEDSYYIFMIFNKRCEWSGQIYDFKYNTLYDTKDIDIDVFLYEDGMLSNFIAEAKKLTTEPPKICPPATTGTKSPTTTSKTPANKKKNDTPKYADYDRWWDEKYGGDYYNQYGGYTYGFE